MVFQILALIVLGLLVVTTAAFAAFIPWHFAYGKNWLGIPFKMSFPALVWPLTVIDCVTILGGLLLALSAPAFTALWYLSLAVAVIAAGVSVANAGYIRRVTAPHDGFARAFGPNWQAKLSSITGLLPRRWSPFGYPNRPVRLKRDEVIWTFPETERQLRADVWQPAEGTKPTGVAFLFFHGSAWHFNDKGIGTDPMFRHLAAQGHVIIDVAYRLAPEVDIAGMTTDVKRAVIWAKQNAARLGIDPHRIVVGGASAGGHISLLTTYGNSAPGFTPDDLAGLDASVAGVVSLYGPSDLRAYLQHHAGRLTMTGKPATARGPVAFDNMWGEQMMFNLCGGMPDEAPAMYDLADVKTHVAPGAPPALIIQGEADFIVPTVATRQLVERLRAASVPVIYVELPQTEHAWDVGTGMANMAMKKQVVPAFLDSQYAPPTQATVHDIERFLAYLAA